MSKPSPTSRTLAECRELGWSVAVVERWNPYARIRQDLFGFADIVAMTGENVVFIQATSGSNHSARVVKLLAEPNVMVAIRSGVWVEVWSWAKKGPKGKPKRWTLRREKITEQMILEERNHE